MEPASDENVGWRNGRLFLPLPYHLLPERLDPISRMWLMSSEGFGMVRSRGIFNAAEGWSCADTRPGRTPRGCVTCPYWSLTPSGVSRHADLPVRLRRLQMMIRVHSHDQKISFNLRNLRSGTAIPPPPRIIITHCSRPSFHSRPYLCNEGPPCFPACPLVW